MKTKSNQIEYIAVSALVLATLSIGATLSSITVNADSTASANASVNVAAACSMSSSSESAHSTTMVNNDTKENVGITTFTATCNDPGGLAIYAVGYSNDEFGNTNMIGTLGNIATGTNDSTSNWSMKLMNTEGFTAPDFLQSTYTAVPSTYTKVAARNSNTTSATSFGVSATYRFHTSATQPADTYVGKVKYTMVHPATEIPPQPQTTQAGCIRYYANTTTAEGTMGCQSISASDTSATLLASNFSRTGYGFAGWSDAYDYETNASAHFYGPNETISFTAGQYTGTNPGLSLYAVWVKSVGSLQDSSKVATVCSGLTQSGPSVTPTMNSVSALTDQRDNQTYAIAKLADGKCWMIENMRLADKDSSNNDIELSSTNTNNPSLPLTNNYTESTTSNHLSPSVNPTTTAWCTTPSAACYDQSMLYTGNFTERASNPTTNNNMDMYSYGAYYNWYSATAGNGKYANGSGYTAPGDICPAGWTLPTNGYASRNFGLLDVALGGTGSTSNYDTTPTGAVMSAAYRSYPNNFLYSGFVYSGSVNYRGGHGYYWSKSALSSYDVYGLGFDSSNVLPSFFHGKDYGFSVRCLAQ